MIKYEKKSFIKFYFHNFEGAKLYFNILGFLLRILKGKKCPKSKLQCSRKIQIWTFGLLVHQINSF